jgi:hypothetical protein
MRVNPYTAITMNANAAALAQSHWPSDVSSSGQTETNEYYILCLTSTNHSEVMLFTRQAQPHVIQHVTVSCGTSPYDYMLCMPLPCPAIGCVDELGMHFKSLPLFLAMLCRGMDRQMPGLDQVQQAMGCLVSLPATIEQNLPALYNSTSQRSLSMTAASISRDALQLALSHFQAYMLANACAPLVKCAARSRCSLVDIAAHRFGHCLEDLPANMPEELLAKMIPHLWRKVALAPTTATNDSWLLLQLAKALDILPDEEQTQQPQLLSPLIGACVIMTLAKQECRLEFVLPLGLGQQPCTTDYNCWRKLIHR